MSPYRVRTEGLADDALVIVRGGDLDIDIIRRDALAAHARFGEGGFKASLQQRVGSARVG